MDMMITRPAGATEKYSVGQFADASFTANADYRLEGTFRYPQFAEEEGTICGATVQIKTGGPSFLANSDVQMGATLQFKTVSGVSTISLELINLSDVSPVSASLSNAEYLKLLGSSDFTLKLYFNRSAGTAKGELYVDDTLKLTKTATIKDKGTLGDPLDPYIPVKNSIYTCAGVSFDLAQSTQLKPTTLAGVQCRDFMVYKKY